MALFLFGIPTCDSCKKARAWLDGQGLAFDWVDLRQSPPTREAIAAWVSTLGAAALRNTSGRSYRALPEAKRDWDGARWVDAFMEDPMLIRRPVLVRDGCALAAGFKPAVWADLTL